MQLTDDAAKRVVGKVLDWTNRDRHLAFLISAVIYFLGAICWLFIDPVTPLEKKKQSGR